MRPGNGPQNRSAGARMKPKAAEPDIIPSIEKERVSNYDPNKKLYEALQNVTLQDITNFEKQNIVGKPYRMVILGNEKDLDMKSLEKIAPIKRLSQEEIFGF